MSVGLRLNFGVFSAVRIEVSWDDELEAAGVRLIP